MEKINDLFKKLIPNKLWKRIIYILSGVFIIYLANDLLLLLLGVGLFYFGLFGDQIAQGVNKFWPWG